MGITVLGNLLKNSLFRFWQPESFVKLNNGKLLFESLIAKKRSLSSRTFIYERKTKYVWVY